MSEFSKHVGIAIFTDPTAVASWCASRAVTPDNGAIICSCPEIGMTGMNLIYCRYGLSIPYYQVAVGEKVLIEPTIGETERWFYTGLVDCGTAPKPTSADQLLIQSALQVIYMATVGTLHLSSKTASEAFVKGTAALVELTKHQQAITELQTAINGWIVAAGDGGAALKAALATFLALPMPDYSSILSTKIFGE